MTEKSEETVEQSAPPAGLHGSDGAIVAGGDVTGSSTQYIEAEQAFVLPPEAYAAIPDDIAADGVSNIGTSMFVGRVDELAALEEAFARPGEVVVHAVHGLGGVGKSALAAIWAARRHEKVRWWVTADTVAAIETGMASLARALQPGLAGLPAELQSERAVAWLAGHAGWLLVLDNVEDPAHIRPLLARVPGGRVLVTTRRATGWHHDATGIRLGVFHPAEAVDLFTRILTHPGPRDTDGADAVCEEVGHLALAVEQAAAYCAETGTNPRDYLDMLARWPATMFATGTEGGDSERTIARIWHLTLNRLADTPLAGSLLRILAWYAPDNIPRDLLHGLAEPPLLAAAIGRLRAYSLIADNHDGTLSVHRVLQALARTPDPDDPHRTPEAVDHARDQAAALLASSFPTDIDQPENWPRCRDLLPHTDALTRHHTPDHDTAHTARALDRAGAYRIGQGSLTPAIYAFQRALATRERVLGGDHPDTLTSRNNLAYAYRAAGDLGRAIPLFQRTLTDCKRVLGGDHPDTLTSRNNLAYAYRAAGDLGRAIPLYERTLTDCERVLGGEHPQTLASRNNLAGAYQAAGDLGRAIPLYERTLTERERVLGGDHPDTLTSRNNLAYAYRAAGDLGRAIPLYERTLTERERVLGGEHPQTLASRNNLAGAYRAAGDLGRAIPLFKRTLTDCKRVLGGEHPQTLASRNNLAGAYRAAGDLGRAIPLYERTLTDCERVLGGEHPDTLASRNSLAGAYQAAGDLGRAIPLFERTLTEQERVLGGDHPHTLTSRNNLAYAYQAAGDLGRAIPLYERSLTDCKRVLSPGHPMITVVQAHLERVRSQ
ncbi:tetratricopeptide repeat protein (plasmid) [Streptomyces sp. NBC_00715]|uniref:tetratricopeptide repeat protein n=1 Tax=Streptomyces sp. NBC_00715 TaxID=2975811 RepID=UPI002F9099FB